MKILVVDDDAAIRSTLADVLAEDGATEVEVAASAEEAIRVLDSSAAPDLVLSDIRMRGLDGMDLLRFVRQRTPASKVVLMTAYHDVGTAVRAMREGASDFLCKPFDLHSLRAVLDRLLERDAPGQLAPSMTDPSETVPARISTSPPMVEFSGSPPSNSPGRSVALSSDTTSSPATSTRTLRASGSSAQRGP